MGRTDAKKNGCGTCCSEGLLSPSAYVQGLAACVIRRFHPDRQGYSTGGAAGWLKEPQGGGRGVGGGS